LLWAQREGRATLLSLAPLSLASVQVLVHNALSSTGKDPVRLSKRLHHETDGLPFFVVEYLKTISSGSPDNREQEWRMPSSVRDEPPALQQPVKLGCNCSNAAAIGRSDFDTLRGQRSKRRK
jgi:predicted ATPase